MRDWSFLSTILQAMKETTQKLCTQGCAERPFLTPLPQKWKFLGLCASDFNFVKPPAPSLRPWLSSAAVASPVPGLGSLAALPTEPHQGISPAPQELIILSFQCVLPIIYNKAGKEAK